MQIVGGGSRWLPGQGGPGWALKIRQEKGGEARQFLAEFAEVSQKSGQVLRLQGMVGGIGVGGSGLWGSREGV